MSHRILHLLSPGLRVRIRLEQLWVEDTEKGTKRSVPLEDVAGIVCATPDCTVTAGALRGLAQRRIPFLICDEKFAPAALTLPYHQPTDSAVLRAQVAWSPEWKHAIWKRIIAAKVRNQAHLLNHAPRQQTLLREIAAQCEAEARPALMLPDGQTLADITPLKRTLYHATTPDASESRAAKHYWSAIMPRWRKNFPDDETRRIPGTHTGINARLDYGYAVLRSAVLRSLAFHGFIAALGVNHSIKPCAHALADDLMEPFRPWVDARLDSFLNEHPEGHDMKEWIHDCPNLLFEPVSICGAAPRLIYAIDSVVRSLADASVTGHPERLNLPAFATPGEEKDNELSA